MGWVTHCSSVTLEGHVDGSAFAPETAEIQAFGMHSMRPEPPGHWVPSRPEGGESGGSALAVCFRRRADPCGGAAVEGIKARNCTQALWFAQNGLSSDIAQWLWSLRDLSDLNGAKSNAADYPVVFPAKDRRAAYTNKSFDYEIDCSHGLIATRLPDAAQSA